MHNMSPLRSTIVALDPHWLHRPVFLNLFLHRPVFFNLFLHLSLDALFVNLLSIEAILSAVISSNVPWLCFTEGRLHTVITQSAFIQPFQRLTHTSLSLSLVPLLPPPHSQDCVPPLFPDFFLSVFLSFPYQKNGYNILSGLGAGCRRGGRPETDGG